jgi:DNA-binding transcriptional MerR regulator
LDGGAEKRRAIVRAVDFPLADEVDETMEKSPEAFRTISEVAEALDVPPHVLRFWETRFTQVKPVKRGGGRRYYRPEDVRLLRGIRGLLYDDGMTIKGVQKILRERGIRHVIGLGTVAFGEGEPTYPATAETLPPRSAPPPREPRREEALFDTVLLAVEPEAAPDEEAMSETVNEGPEIEREVAPEAPAAPLTARERGAHLSRLVLALEALRAEMILDPED